MSGTSLDGLDAVAVRWSPTGSGLSCLSRARRDFDAALRRELLELNAPGHDELHKAALAANRISTLAAEAVTELLAGAGLTTSSVRAIGLHGQTVRHRPTEFDGVGYSLQIHNASLLAELSGIDVVCDFRSRDVAGGGQGAPLVPAFHAGVFHQPGRDVAVLNLGGIANLTLLHADGRVAGFDCGPANVLMDHWIQECLGRAFDESGAWAASGRVDPELLRAFQADDFFRMRGPKSTGRDRFNRPWLESVAGDRLHQAASQDVQATLCELTAWAAHEHLRRELPQARILWVCGGGAFNAHLMGRLRSLMEERLPGPLTVAPSSDAGMDPMDVEPTAFAWLARRFLLREPGNLAAVTGAKGPRILGALYPAGPGSAPRDA